MIKRIGAVSLLLCIGVLLAAAVPGFAGSPESPANPEKGGPPGIYVFYDWQRIDPKKYPVMGGAMSWDWDVIEYAAGKYNWSAVDKFISDQAALGKLAGLRIVSYNGDCCGGSSVPTFHKNTTPKIVLTCSSTEIPRYWDASYKNAWSKLVKSFGARYNGDPRVGWVEISTGIFGETAPSEDKYDDCLLAAGLSNQAWTDFVNWSTDTYLSAFPTKQLLLQYAPRYLERKDRKNWTDYAASKGVGLKHNGLKPDANSDAYITDPSSPSYLAGQYDPFTLWGDKVPTAFEGTESSLGLYDRTSTMWSLYNGLDKHVDWLVLDDKVSTKAEYQDLLKFAVKYLGKTEADTPSAWIAMRETEFDWFPDYGNYEFYLYQRDGVPGGKTVAVWNVGGPEGRYSRRTDQASGNANIYLDLDDDYVYGGQNRATITVTYYDKGTDAWELWYDGVSEDSVRAGRIVKTDTRTWKKAVFEVNGAEFANGLAGGSDLRLFSANDGDETIHMVDVVATPSEPKKLTLRAGVDGWSGLTDTYISAWSVDKNFGTSEQNWLGYPDKMFTLERWDLAPIIPQNSKVMTATLSLYQTGNTLDYANPLTINAHRLLKRWDQAGATWNKATSSVAWQQPGAMGSQDRDPAPSSTVNANMLTGWVQLNITSLVQQWVDDPTANFGLLLKGITDRNSQWYFAGAKYADISRRPSLEISYYEPAKPKPTSTPTATRTAAPTATSTGTPSRTPSPTPGTATHTPTATATRAPTETPTQTPTSTPIASVRTLVSRLVGAPPLIDGVLNEWAQTEMAVLDFKSADHIVYQPAPASSDISVELRSFWDTGWLYFGVHVTDERLYGDSSEVWHDDGVELALDGLNDLLALGADDHQYTAVHDGRLADFGVLLSPNVAGGASLAVRKTGTGYDMELAIPLSMLQAGPLVAGKTMGFNIGVNDDDDGGARNSSVDNWLVWQGQSTYNTPSQYGKLVLGNLYQYPASTPTSTPTATHTAPPTATTTSAPTATATPTASRTPTSTATSSPTATATSSPTATPTRAWTGRVSGRVWLDRNANGQLDAGESGLPGVTLFLAADSPVAGDPVATATTAQTGRYEFKQVPPGRYSIAIQEGPYFRSTTPRKQQLAMGEGAELEISFGVCTTTMTTYLPMIMQVR